ncbi:MAG: PLDc N-terminal domain-containing protein [Candidatus Korobacteraceae bacterium]
MRIPRLIAGGAAVLALRDPSLLALTQRDAGAGAAGCFACSGFIGFIVAFVVLNIAILVWVARDAKARGMDSAILWMLLVMFTGVIGLVIYLFVRPQGNMVQCPNCHNKRLQASVKCPHCSIGA